MQVRLTIFNSVVFIHLWGRQIPNLLASLYTCWPLVNRNYTSSWERVTVFLNIYLSQKPCVFNCGENCFPSSFFLTRVHILNMRFCALFKASCFVCLFWHMVSPYSTGCPETLNVDQDGLEITEIHLPYPPQCWDLKVCTTICTSLFLSPNLVSLLYYLFCII